MSPSSGVAITHRSGMAMMGGKYSTSPRPEQREPPGFRHSGQAGRASGRRESAQSGRRKATKLAD